MAARIMVFFIVVYLGFRWDIQYAMRGVTTKAQRGRRLGLLPKAAGLGKGGDFVVVCGLPVGQVLAPPRTRRGGRADQAKCHATLNSASPGRSDQHPIYLINLPRRADLLKVTLLYLIGASPPPGPRRGKSSCPAVFPKIGRASCR